MLEGVLREMTNRQLLEFLQGLPPEKPVALFWDGSSRNSVEGIVDDDHEIVLVGDWSIYREGTHRVYLEEQIKFG